MARPEDQNEEGKDENLDNSDDSFGLPEIDYEPLKREDPSDNIREESFTTSESDFAAPEPPLDIPSPPIQETRKEEYADDSNAYYEPSYSYSYEEERPSIWPKLLGVILLLAIAGAVFSARALFEFAVGLLEQEKVACVPGSAFGPMGEGFIRLCFARDPRQVGEAIERLRPLLN